MAYVKVNSRRIFFGAAFVGAMAGSGALFGLICGFMLLLLGHSVLHADGATLFVLIFSGALGMAMSTIWSVLLVTGQGTRMLAWKHATPVQQDIEGI